MTGAILRMMHAHSKTETVNPQDLGDEVVSSLLDLFMDGSADAAWHGGCLALAELARRGLLLPARLPELSPLICRGLHFDVRRGPHRSAPCFVSFTSCKVVVLLFVITTMNLSHSQLI